MIKIASAINFLHSAHPNWISIIFALKCPAHSILFCKYITSTQDYIDEVVSINNLNNDSSIVAGTNLVIPYYEVTDLN